MTRLPTFVLILATVGASLTFGQNAGFEVTGQFSLPGGGPVGPMGLDKDSHRLFVPKGDHVLILDDKSLEEVGDIQNIPGVSGIAVDRMTGRVYTVSRSESSLTVLIPDSAGYERHSVALRQPADLVFVDFSNQRGIVIAGSEVTAVEPGRGNVLTGGLSPNFGAPIAVAEGQLGRAYVLYRGRVGVLDTEHLTMPAEDMHPLGKDCQNPSGVLLESSGAHLLVACTEGKLKRFNTSSWKEMQSFKICRGAKGLAEYVGEDFIVTSCPDRLLLLQEQHEAPFFTKLQELRTQQGIYSVLLDPNRDTNDPRILLGVHAGDRASGEKASSLTIQKVSRPGASASRE